MGYYLGRDNGISAGKNLAQDNVVRFFVDERYDALQNTKFARSTKEQNDILDIAGTSSKALNILDRNGYVSEK